MRLKYNTLHLPYMDLVSVSLEHSEVMILGYGWYKVSFLGLWIFGLVYKLLCEFSWIDKTN